MHLGYNTNGFAHHDPREALELLGEIGYRSAALTLDHGLLNPCDPQLAREVAEVRKLLRALGMRSAVETGARFLLSPRLKHEPTLVSADARQRGRRVEFLKQAIDIAAELQSDCVSLWSGMLREPDAEDTAWTRLLDGLGEVLAHAEKQQVVLGFEPEPGMLIATLADYRRLKAQLPSDRLRLTLDIGHVHCQQEGSIAQLIEQFADDLINIHIEDMRAGVHEHLQFGDGEIDFPPIIRALNAVGYSGPLHVELSRHSHMAPEAARTAYSFLARLLAADQR